MDIGDNRHRAALNQGFERGGAFLIRARHPDDIDPGLGRGINLGHGGFDIVGQGVGHGLDRDRGITTHRNGPDHDLATSAAGDITIGSQRH